MQESIRFPPANSMAIAKSATSTHRFDHEIGRSARVPRMATLAAEGLVVGDTLHTLLFANSLLHSFQACEGPRAGRELLAVLGQSGVHPVRR